MKLNLSRLGLRLGLARLLAASTLRRASMLLLCWLTIKVNTLRHEKCSLSLILSHYRVDLILIQLR